MSVKKGDVYHSPNPPPDTGDPESGPPAQCAGDPQEASAFERQVGGTQMSADGIDPTGRGSHEPGAKLDAGKARLGMVLGGFARALEAVGDVGTYGARKYTDHGWTAVPDGDARYTDALFRHLLAEYSGERDDPESGLSHAAHAAWNALARLDLAIRAQEEPA